MSRILLISIVFVFAASACTFSIPREPDSSCVDDEGCESGTRCDGACVLVTNNGSNNGSNNGTNGESNNGSTNAANNGIGETSHFFLEIRDTTSGVGCEREDPGADMLWSYVAANDGTPLAFASSVDEKIVKESNNYAEADVFTGDVPSDGFDSCPEFDVTTVLSLGCGGLVIVEFLDMQSIEFGFISGKHTIEVSEYGAQCGGSSEDAFSVAVCTSSEEVRAGVFTSCTSTIGNGSGQLSIEL